GAADPRVVLMLDEAFRHGKALGAWPGAEEALRAAGIPVDAPGVVTGGSGAEILDELTTLLTEHRVWDRFPPAE
ncbi:hypothetical protein GT030_23135, partial [Streptomyces sp. SID1328]|uniref:hypothetical protein n=1 Tax=Streptomyces sp. SID1328 TaxID=2690250 RepID=UPI00136ECE58